ncbi:KR domain-containing protein, partial [Micromonospora rifamycinica]|uniref:KR domain-containing protein n=1 Tax=Micromonospora rifamycinica TaxID=291594 RepID=UPI00344192C4
TITTLTTEQLHTVLRNKADTAWHLHQLTTHHHVGRFVLYSSLAATVGNAGQANYAAANAFLDALAHHRHQHHQPATSLAWGLWAARSAMTGQLEEVDLARMARTGILPIEDERGLRIFDAAVDTQLRHVVAAEFDTAVLARGDRSPAMLRGLVREPVRRRARAVPSSGPALAQRLSGMAPAEQTTHLLTIVMANIAAVLGHSDAASIDPARPFRDLGFDSLTAVELRNRLGVTTGLQLAATMAFDHPTPIALSEYLRELLVPPPPSPRERLRGQLDELETTLAMMERDDMAEIAARLRTIAARFLARPPATVEEPPVSIADASLSEVFDFIDNRLGRSVSEG